MQEQNAVMTYIPVPTELLEEAGITSSDVMQMHVSEGKLIVENLKKPRKCCEDTPYDHEICQYLAQLSPGQKYKAMVFLTLMWAEKQFNQIIEGEPE